MKKIFTVLLGLYFCLHHICINSASTNTIYAVSTNNSVSNEYGLTVSPAEITIAEGESFQINVPYDTDLCLVDSTYFYSYGDSVAVNSLGKATAYKAGEDEIIVTAIIRTDDNSYDDISFSVIVHITSGEVLSDDKQAELDRLEGDKYDNYQRRKIELFGGLKENSPRITMEQVSGFIDESDSPTEIFRKIDSVHSYPDVIGGSGVISSEYWFDEKGNEKIVCRTDIGQEEICYYKISKNGTILERKMIYPEEIDYTGDKLYTDYHYRQYNQVQPDGDINADDEFNITDAVIVQKMLYGMADSKYKNWDVVNFCNDRVLNVFDLCLMKQKLIG